jgi:hypothetical protein
MKMGPVHGWGDFPKMFGKGGVWCGPGLPTTWPYFGNAITSDFEPHMHKYLQQPLPKHLEKKPMKRKEK